jgi:hypothetical protein
MAATQEAVTEQIQEPGLDDKLDKLFAPKEEPTQTAPEAVQETAGDEATTEAAPESAEAPSSVSVEFNGTTYEVPPELKDALMQHSDYTQKTQNLASLRRDLELQQKEIALLSEQSAFAQSIANEVDTLKMLEQYIPYTEANTNWQGLTTDQFVRKQKELADLTKQKDALAKSIQTKQKEWADKLDAKRKEFRKEIGEAVGKAIQGWSDTVKAEVESYIKSMGYPEANVGLMSSLDYQLAWKAMKYDKLKSETKSAVKKAGDAPVIKATSRNEMPKKVQERLNTLKVLKKATPGSPEHKAALDKRLSQMFGG